MEATKFDATLVRLRAISHINTFEPNLYNPPWMYSCAIWAAPALVQERKHLKSTIFMQPPCNRSCNTALGSPMFRYDTTTAPQDLHEHWSQPAPQCGQLLHLGLLHDWGQAVRSLEQRTDDADEGLVHFAHQHTDPPGKSALLRHLWCCGADDHGWDVEPLRYVWSSTGLEGSSMDVQSSFRDFSRPICLDFMVCSFLNGLKCSCPSSVPNHKSSVLLPSLGRWIGGSCGSCNCPDTQSNSCSHRALSHPEVPTVRGVLILLPSEWVILKIGYL